MREQGVRLAKAKPPPSVVPRWAASEVDTHQCGDVVLQFLIIVAVGILQGRIELEIGNVKRQEEESKAVIHWWGGAVIGCCEGRLCAVAGKAGGGIRVLAGSACCANCHSSGCGQGAAMNGGGV